MKKNLLLAVTVAVTAISAFDLSTLRAQPPSATAPAPGSPAAPPPAPAPAPGMPPAPRGPRRMVPAMIYRRTIMSLKQAKMQLQRAQGDLDGHKQTAMDACDKAIEELTAAVKASAPPPPQAAPPVQQAPPSQ